MRVDILTIFPDMFQGPFQESIVKRAVDRGLVAIHVHDIRRWAIDRHKTVDDYPYGGGPGMVMKPEPVFVAVEAVKALDHQECSVVLLTPVGRPFNHQVAVELAQRPRLILLCGHYEGVDARVHEHLADDRLRSFGRRAGGYGGR
jgi:tRNA (guanine37-N1)-methyltransferase